MIYDFDAVPDRRASESIKWHAYAPDVLPLWVADMDFVSPQPVIEALQQRVAQGVFGYPVGVMNSPRELPELRAVLTERMARLYGWQVQPEAIVWVPGIVTGLNLAAHALARPDGGVLVQTPVYPPFLTIAQSAGALHQQMALTRLPDGRYEIDWDAFEAAFTPQTRLFVLCNPHNPVGRAYTVQELTRMAEICLRRGVTMVSDEIHCDLLFSGVKHTPLASLSPEAARQTITLMAPSKTFNIAGLESSFAIIPDRELRKQFLGARQGLVGWVNLLALTAMEAAYRHGDEWLTQLLAYLEANRDFLAEYVRAYLPGVQMALPEATYLAWLDCRALELPGGPYSFFLEQARVALNDGQTFGAGGEGFARLNFGCPRATLVEALERMRAALNARSG